MQEEKKSATMLLKFRAAELADKQLFRQAVERSPCKEGGYSEARFS